MNSQTNSSSSTPSNQLLNTGIDMVSSIFKNTLSKPETTPSISKIEGMMPPVITQMLKSVGTDKYSSLLSLIGNTAEKVQKGAPVDLTEYINDIQKIIKEKPTDNTPTEEAHREEAPKEIPRVTLPKLNIEDMIKNLQMEFGKESLVSPSETETKYADGVKYVDGISPETHGIRVYDAQTKMPFDFSRMDPDADTILIPKERVAFGKPESNEETVVINS